MNREKERIRIENRANRLLLSAVKELNSKRNLFFVVKWPSARAAQAWCDFWNATSVPLKDLEEVKRWRKQKP